LIRWSNLENKKNARPNIRNGNFLRVLLILEDVYLFCILLILYKYYLFGLIASYILVVSCILSGLTNIILHIISANKNLREKKI